MTMCGALLQMLPVVAGLRLRGPVRFMPLAALLLALGTLLLVAGFLSGGTFLFAAAAVLLAAAFGLLLACLARTLFVREVAAPVADIVRGMRGAVLALMLTVGCGLPLAVWLAGGPAVPAVRLTDVHAGLGLAGWVLTLVVAVSFQVLPMFQATALYPRGATRWIVPALAVTLLAWTTLHWLPLAAAGSVDAGMWDANWLARCGGAGVAAAYAVVSLRLLWRRRRGKVSASTGYWYLALAALGAGAILFAWPNGRGGEGDDARALAVGVLFIGGFAMAAVNGMLYKIVPFLIWHQLQERATTGTRVPKMTEMVTETALRIQFGCHAAAVAACLAACWYAPAARPGGILLAIACLRLGLDLARPALRHREVLKPETPPQPS
ncbi:hypothetical protein E4L96_07615 [Massilia arenosa]|uniref:Uncharacterized protein n=2 Tax=Zemynaea arenosa TaxID=2561931 RepID=A0A4Y9SLF7_9BURK|nr:hypothetical protein E4L96_07615 [Massilia arenosa]